MLEASGYEGWKPCQGYTLAAGACPEICLCNLRRRGLPLNDLLDGLMTVSYTHLTLPTILRV